MGSALLWCLWEPVWNISLRCPTERQRNLGISFFFVSLTNWGSLLGLLALWHFQPAPRGRRISQTERSRKPSAYIGTTSSELLEQAKRLRLERQTAPLHIPFIAFPNPTSAFQIGLEEPSHWSHSTNVLATLHNFVVSLGGLSPLHCGHFKSKVFTHLRSPHLARCLGLIKPNKMGMVVSKHFTFIIMFYTWKSPYLGDSIIIFIILIFMKRNLKYGDETELDGGPYLLMARPVAKLLQFLLLGGRQEAMAFTWG